MMTSQEKLQRVLDAIPDEIRETDWPLLAPRFIYLWEDYVASLPWHQRMLWWLHRRRAVIRGNFEFFVVLPLIALWRALR